MSPILSLVLLSLAVVFAEDELPGIDTEVVFKPEDCTVLTKVGDVLKMHYTGTLQKDGSQFDSSRDAGTPFQFQLGSGQVIKGWEVGLQGMCKGEKRKLTIPSHLAYGEQGAGERIPPNSDLVFDVELEDFQKGPDIPNVFKDIDADGDRHLSQEEVSGYIKDQAKTHGGQLTDTEHNEYIKQIFDHDDKDKDGSISHAEFSGPKHDEL